MAEFALTIVALRRAGRELAAVPVPCGDIRAGRPRRRRVASGWSWRLQVGSLLTCAAIVGLVILPHGPRVHLARRREPVRPIGASRRRLAIVAESRLAARPDLRSVAAVGNLPPRYPDGLTRPWKEVPTTDATQRETRAFLSATGPLARRDRSGFDTRPAVSDPRPSAAPLAAACALCASCPTLNPLTLCLVVGGGGGRRSARE